MGIRILSTNRLLPVNALSASFGKGQAFAVECRAIGKTYDFILLCCLRERNEILRPVVGKLELQVRDKQSLIDDLLERIEKLERERQ